MDVYRNPQIFQFPRFLYPQILNFICLPVIINISLRYGLTLFHDVIEIVNFSSSIWGTPTELYNEFGFSRTGYNEDGYLGINHILSSYTFRSSAQKHIILFTDEVRQSL